MSKKKNTLKDLDEFLKQQAASLVTPEPVSVTPEPEKVIPPTDYSQHKTEQHHITTDQVFNALQKLSQEDPDSFRQKFYALTVQIFEAQPTSLPEDKMMINTALYLMSGDNWKEAIRQYWKKKV